MRKKLKRRFINKIQRNGVPVHRGLFFAHLSDSIEEMKEMRRLTKVKNRHKLKYVEHTKWVRWLMYDIIVKRTGRRLGATNTLPSWYVTK